MSCILMVSAINLYFPVLLKKLIDSNLTIANFKEAFPTMFLLFLTLGIFETARFYFVMSLGDTFITNLRNKLFTHLTKQDIAFFDKFRTGELLSRVNSDITQLRSSFIHVFSSSLASILRCVGSLGIMFFTNYYFTFIILSFLAIALTPIFFLLRKVKDNSARVQEEIANFSAFFGEIILSIRYILTSDIRDIVDKKNRQNTSNIFSTQMYGYKITGLYIMFISMVLSSGVALVTYFGLLQVYEEKLTRGEFLQFSIYIFLFTSSINRLSNLSKEYSITAGSVRQLSKIFKIHPKIKSEKSILMSSFWHKNPEYLIEQKNKVISFKDVHFSYGNRAKETVLSNIDFDIKDKVKLAIVGKSGSGKSSLINLLLRLYDPIRGQVNYMGQNIIDFNPYCYRSMFGLVPQNAALFHGSIADNLSLFKSGISKEQMWDSLEKAKLADFVNKLDAKLATKVTELGSNVSAGQRQRLAIAREMINNKPILILDEAMNALDNENRYLVSKVIFEQFSEKIVIIITHQLEFINNCDEIILLDNGSIIEKGTYSELTVNKNSFLNILINFSAVRLD